VKVEIAQDLPTVYGDRSRLLEVVQNLMDNAVKFMGEQPEPKVGVGVQLVGDETVFYVSDNGMGIDGNYQDRIFRIFDKVDRDSEGTGIGLSLVKRIIEVHGGRLWVESAGRGRGSTFRFTLPVIDMATDQTHARERER
jgi:signal transduction histidine kinase